MMRRVVVTGLGTINPLGNDWQTTWNHAKAGQNGLDFITRFESETVGMNIAGEIKDFDFSEYLGRKEYRRLDRFSMVAIKASDEAIADAGLDFDQLDRDRIGVYFTSGIGGLDTISSEAIKGYAKGYHRISPFFIPTGIINIAAGNIAIRNRLHGIATASVTACAAAANTMGNAFRDIRHGYIDIAITGGTEASVNELGISGFKVMQALSKAEDPSKASTPFDLNRSGFVMGEGSAAIILESLDSALARKAPIYAELVGFGSTCDATHITAPDSEGTGAMKCMKIALEDGQVPLEELGYINAHGTSTPLNDKIETLAIKRLFKDHAYNLSISSTKSMTGHLLGASGAIEALFTIMALKESFIPPTIGFETPDPECDLDYTFNQGKEKAFRYALSNSLGFGGHNATLVFKKWED